MDIVELLKTWHDQLIAWSSELRFDKTHQPSLHKIALYGSILEFTGCIVVLLENRGQTGIPSLFRSLLEAAVEARNLAADDAYIEYMHASHQEQWLRVLQQARDGNPFLISLAQLPNLDEIIATTETTLALLSQRNFRPLSVFDRFQKAKMVEEYRSLYNFLSCDAHSNIRALIARHIELGDNDFNVVYYKDEPVETFLASLDSTAGLLLEASKSIHAAFESPRINDVRALEGQLIEARRQYAT